MTTPEAIAQAAWEYHTRTLVSGTPAPPTNHAEYLASAVWAHSVRTLNVAPGAITDLDAVAVSATRIDLTWTPASNASAHRIERAQVSSG